MSSHFGRTWGALLNSDQSSSSASLAAYNLAKFLQTTTTPELIERWSLSSLRERLIKAGARRVRHGRYAIFQMAEVAIPHDVFPPS